MDDNCNELIDEGLPLYNLFIDTDNDNFGDVFINTISCLFEITGFCIDSTDCNDSNPLIYPGSEEILNGLDDNCNGTVDEGIVEILNNHFTSFTIYPNPNSGIFEISISSQISTSIIIEVVNLFGENIYTKHFKQNDILQIKLNDSFTGVAAVIISANGISVANLINIIK